MRRIVVVVLFGLAACAEVEVVEPAKPPRLVGPIPAIGRTLDLEVEGRGTPVRLRGVTGRVTAVCVLGGGASPAARGGAARASELPRSGPAVEAPPEQEAEPIPEAAGSPAAAPGADAAIPPAGRSAPPPAQGVEPIPEAAGSPAAAPGADEAIPPPARSAPRPGAEAAAVLAACERLAAALADRIAVVSLATDPAADVDAFAMRTYKDPRGEALSEALELDARSRVLLVDRQGRVAEVLDPDDLDRLERAAARLVF